MSVYIVNVSHIHAIVTFANSRLGTASFWDEIAGNQPQQLGELLLTQNVRSVDERMNEQHIVEAYRFRAMPEIVGPVEFLKLLDCLELQSTAAPGWRHSMACQQIERMRRAAIRLLPGYDDAPWEQPAAGEAVLYAVG
jgi:hypothetical protein